MKTLPVMIKQVINNVLEGVLVSMREESILDHVNNLEIIYSFIFISNDKNLTA